MGPISAFIFGNCSGVIIAYQAFKNDSIKINLLESWKEKQEDFNQRTVSAIARLKALIKDPQP